MCQLQIIKRLDNKNISPEDINEFYKLMSFGSIKNNDAFGLFNSHYNFKKSGRFNPNFFSEDSLNDNFVVGHNRLATSGFEYELPEKKNFILDVFGFMPIITKKADNNLNNHPFIKDDFMLVHNGVIYNAEKLREEYNIKSDIKTDSYVVLEIIYHYFNKNYNKDRLKGIVDAIKKTTRKIDGFYSIFLFDKVSNSLIYFKDNYADFYFYVIDNKLVGSTSWQNLNYVYFKSKKKYKIGISPNTIYLINNSQYNPLQEIGTFQKKKLFSWFFEKEEKEVEVK